MAIVSGIFAIQHFAITTDIGKLISPDLPWRQRELAFEAAFPDRRDRIDALMEEGDHVWMRFSTSGTHKGPLCGVPPTGRRVGVPVVSLMKFVGGEWKETWTFADELGMMLQLGAPNLLVAG